MTAVPPPVPPQAPPAVSAPASGLELEQTLIPDVVRALCLSTGHTRYAISPDVVAMTAKLTVALVGSADDVWRDGLSSLALAGVKAVCVKGLCRFSQAEVVAEKSEVPAAVLSYLPKHRDAAFLASSLSSMFQGWHFAGAGSSASGPGASGSATVAAVSASSGSGSGASAGRATPQESVPVRLVGLGPAPERSRVVQALAELDREVPAMVVRVAVYEVDVSKSSPYALALVAKILGGASTVNIGAAVPTTLAAGSASGAVTVKVGDFSAVVGALDSASEVHLVTAPTLRTSSGVLASFAVGDSVPTLGSVSYTQGSSTPVQSIQYQQSGVVFSVVPQLVGELVDVALYQSVSSFTATTSGVTSSPTLQNRALSSDVILRPGETVILGGLMQSNDSHGSSGWWLLPSIAHQSEYSKTELVVCLSVELEGGR